MQPNQDQNQQQGQITGTYALGMIYAAANVLATSMAVFLRRGFGREALSWNSMLALLVLVVLIVDDPLFGYFALAFLFAQLVRRVETFRLIRKGAVIHSRYAGYPYWAMKVPLIRDEKVAREAIEPLICFLTGLMLCPLSVGIGGYVMCCGVAFTVRHALEEEVSRKRVERMQDAQIEHEWYAEQLRR